MRRGPLRLLLPIILLASVLALAAIAPETPDPSERPNFAEEVGAGARRLVAGAVGFVLGRDVEVGVVELVLLAIVLAWVFGLWRERRRRCRQGSTNVEPFVNTTGDESVSAEGLTALVKDRLAGGGLLPAPALPSGVMATRFVDLVEASPLPQAKWLGAGLNLVRSLVSRPDRSHKLTGTLRKREAEDGCGLSVELIDGNTGEVEAVATFWERTYLDAAKAAAGFAYARVMHAISGCTPLWQAWTNLQGESVALYHRGLEAEQAFMREKAKEERSQEHMDTKLEEALNRYEDTLELEPMNVLVKLRKANLHELADHWAEALDTYLDALERWPRVFDARYRLAVTLTYFIQRLEDEAADREVRESLLARLQGWMQTCGIESPDRSPDSSEAGHALCMAFANLERLHRDNSFGTAVRDWLGTLVPSWSGELEQRRDRHVYASLARPWSRQRRERRNVVALARVCTGSQLGRFGEDDVATYLRPGRAKNWQVRYNASCCYSRLFEREGRAGTVTKAIRQLEIAYQEAGGHLELGWIRADPDLAPLHGQEQFQRWLARPRKEASLSRT